MGNVKRTTDSIEGDAQTTSGTKVQPEADTATAAQAFLEILSLRGIDCFFANAGTDFASIEDAFVCREKQGKTSPRPLIIPHEIPLVSMAHGYYIATGRPQVAMVHVGIGTANGLGGIISANRGRVPVLFFAGRTPISEEGSPASRTGHIHWGQESFDQGGMVREFVKWDYELRNKESMESAIDRAMTIAMTEPRGPVYMTMPREVLVSPMEGTTFRSGSRYDLPSYPADSKRAAEAAEMIARAKFPLIITSSAGRSVEAVKALTDLAENAGIGVVPFRSEFMNFPLDHPCHLGFESGPLTKEADVILVVDCDVPWIPNTAKPDDSARIIQIGIDPLYSSYPMRSFPSDLTIQGDPTAILQEIAGHLPKNSAQAEKLKESRMKKFRSLHDKVVKTCLEEARECEAAVPIEPKWVSYNVGQFLDEDTIVVNEHSNEMEPFASRRPGSYFCNTHSGYLGWGVGSALGIKLARPEKTVIATVGDGCYYFSVPSACHFSSAAYDLPFLVIVYNNRSWNAVKRSTCGLHPDGWAARSGRFPLSHFPIAPDYEKICEAFGGYGEKVETPDQMGPAIERALHAVKVEKRQALLNVVLKRP